MGNILIPKSRVEITGPLIFLAGPIRSAPNWQDDAIELLLSKDDDILVASPRRGIRDCIAPYVVQDSEEYFPRQRAWERHYLEYAARNGAIMFWLPGEDEHNCAKPYGAMTRLELGQWMTRYRNDSSVRFCVGSDDQFSELDTIRYDLSVDAPDKDIKTTLEETCYEALRLARQT